MVPNITLNNGVEIPQLGFGTYLISPNDTVEAVTTALKTGYRHIDTAQMYGNEAEVGQAIAESGLSRAEVFITTKLNNGYHKRDDALYATDVSLQRLGVDQVDLYLIHWPLPMIGVDYVETWKAMIDVLNDGKARAIGVSNFLPKHLDRIIDATGVVPAANQVQSHPYSPNNVTRQADKKYGIATEAWAPIARGEILSDPTIVEIAKRIGRTPAQVVLRWHIQRGDIVIPKSIHPVRIAENFDIFDFNLSNADMNVISNLDTGVPADPNPDTFDYIPAN
ncbi:MAG: aldo/keto reductase [Cellulomonadaceae bacterium]|jgi:2,5-diketo-D-gluconate reductase A|nr:aldo/keto reductase [Cellulomonadaceae bacterium]